MGRCVLSSRHDQYSGTEAEASSLLIPNNEGMVCDAIARLLESRTGEQRADVRHPELDGVGPRVDLRLRLGIQEYAIEHTRLESFESQVETGVGFSKISKHIETSLTDKLPGPACYDLDVPVSVSLRGKAFSETGVWTVSSIGFARVRNAWTGGIRGKLDRVAIRSDPTIVSGEYRRGSHVKWCCYVGLMRCR